MVTTLPAGRLVLFVVAGAVDFCVLVDVPAELRATARSAKEPACACGRGRALPDDRLGTASALGELVRDGAVPSPARGVGVIRGAMGETGFRDGGGAGVCGGAGGGVTVVFSTRTGTGSLVTTAPLTVAVATSA